MDKQIQISPARIDLLQETLDKFLKWDPVVDTAIREMFGCMVVLMGVLSKGDKKPVLDVLTSTTNVTDRLMVASRALIKRYTEAGEDPQETKPEIPHEEIKRMSTFLNKTVPEIMGDLRPILKKHVSSITPEFGHASWQSAFFTATSVLFMENWGVDLFFHTIRAHVEHPQLLHQILDAFGPQPNDEDIS